MKTKNKVIIFLFLFSFFSFSYGLDDNEKALLGNNIFNKDGGKETESGTINENNSFNILNENEEDNKKVDEYVPTIKDIYNAQILSENKIIKDNSSSPEKYNYASNITRKEMLKIMINLSGVNLDEECREVFEDLKKDDWGCKYATTALKHGFIKQNKWYRPNQNVSKIEALKMLFRARNIEKDDGNDWKVGYIKKAKELQITESFEDYDASAKRYFIFGIGAKVLKITKDNNSTEENDTTNSEISTGGTATGGIISSGGLTNEIINLKHNYSKNKDKVFFNSQIIVGADPLSFKILEDFHYSKDNNNVYYCNDDFECSIFTGALADTFEFIGDGYAKDEFVVYNTFMNQLIGSNPETFEIVDSDLGYSKDDKNVYNFYGVRIPLADPHTFEVLEKSTYTKDKNHVYNGFTEIIPQADVESFEVIDEVYSKDNANVYYGNSGKILPQADVESFEVIDGMYSKDRNNIYYYDKNTSRVTKVIGASPTNFKSFNYGYFSDGNNIFYNGKKIPNVDVRSFIFDISKNIYKDKNGVIIEGKKITGIDFNSFVSLGEYYFLDKNNIYYNGDKINGADQNSFEIINNDYAKDKNKVYYKSSILQYANPKTIKIKSNGIQAYDDKYFYYLGKYISGASEETFENINGNYYRDKYVIYFKNNSDELEKISEADVIGFVSFESSGFAVDQKNVYFDGKKLNNIDRKTFQYFEGGYAKDKNNIYYKGEKIEGIDKNSFQNLNGGYARDDNNYYYEGKKIN